MVWNKFSRVWTTSSWCDQNYDGVILKIDGVIKIFTVWSNVNGVMKRYFGVNKRPFFGNCVITPYGVIYSHVFSWWSFERLLSGPFFNWLRDSLIEACRHSSITWFWIITSPACLNNMILNNNLHQGKTADIFIP